MRETTATIQTAQGGCWLQVHLAPPATEWRIRQKSMTILRPIRQGRKGAQANGAKTFLRALGDKKTPQMMWKRELMPPRSNCRMSISIITLKRRSLTPMDQHGQSPYPIQQRTDTAPSFRYFKQLDGPTQEIRNLTREQCWTSRAGSDAGVEIGTGR